MAISLDDLLEGSDLLGHLGVLQARGTSLCNLQLALVESLSLNLPLGLEGSNDVLVLPADLVSEPAKRAEPPAVLQPQHLEGGRDDHLFLFVIWGRHSLEALQSLESFLSTLSLVRSHSAHGAPEDLGRSTEVERSTAGLYVTTLLQEVEILQLVTVEVSAHVDALGPDDHDLVAGKQQLGNSRGKPAHQMAASIKDNRLGRYTRHSSLVEVNQAIKAWSF